VSKRRENSRVAEPERTTEKECLDQPGQRPASVARTCISAWDTAVEKESTPRIKTFCRGEYTAHNSAVNFSTEPVIVVEYGISC